MRKKWNLSHWKGVIFFAVMSQFYKSQSERKWSARGNSYKKPIKQNINLKFFQRFFDSFMHDRKKSEYNTKSQKFAYLNLMYYFKCITKSEHGVSNIPDEVKARIRRKAITEFQEQDRYKDKLKSWFQGILPFDHFFLLQNEFQSQFYWLIYIIIPIIRGQGVASVLLIIFP